MGLFPKMQQYRFKLRNLIPISSPQHSHHTRNKTLILGKYRKYARTNMSIVSDSEQN